MKIMSLFSKKRVILFSVLIIVIFQIYKKLPGENKFNSHKAKITEYDKLLYYYPVYKDSIYYIYITKITGVPKIIYLNKDSISDMQRNSKFFLHLYPKDSSLLKDNQSFLAFDFKNNVSKYNLKGRQVYISEQQLPKFKIKKINTGQYGYDGDPKINWRIQELINAEDIDKNLKGNH